MTACNKCIWIALLATLILSACSKDEDNGTYPRLRTEYFDVLIDADTVVQGITLDNGRYYPLNEGNTIKSQVADTIIRCIGQIEIASDSTFATIYSVTQAQCFAPSEPNTYKPYIFYKNPVDVISAYKARHYINIIISSKIGGVKSHVYDIIKDSITTSHLTNKKTMHMTFFHYKAEDELEGYSQHLYMSVPMEPSYYKPTEQFDSVCLHVFTYDGEKIYTYER